MLILTAFRAIVRIGRGYRIQRLVEQCAGLNAKINYWSTLSRVDGGGLSSYFCDKIGQWREQLAVLESRKAYLESMVARTVMPAAGVTELCEGCECKGGVGARPTTPSPPPPVGQGGLSN